MTATLGFLSTIDLRRSFLPVHIAPFKKRKPLGYKVAGELGRNIVGMPGQIVADADAVYVADWLSHNSNFHVVCRARVVVVGSRLGIESSTRR